MQENRTTCVYVLTSDGTDRYADINWISAASLRIHNPNAVIVLVCDAESAAAIEKVDHGILDTVDQLVAVKTPPGTPGFRNRFVKTGIRQHVGGPFLFLDADTLVRASLSQVFESSADFAAAANHSGSGHPSEMPSCEVDMFNLMGWEMPTRYYVNGGVLFFADSLGAYDFCDIWHQHWLASFARTGKHLDQPSLNAALAASGVNFQWLPTRFNAQVHARPASAKGAAIWHIYTSDHHASPETVLDLEVKRLNASGQLGSRRLAGQCARVHPWSISNPVDYLAVLRLLHDEGILDGDRWERLWLANRHRRALSRLFAPLRQRLNAMAARFFSSRNSRS